MKNPFIKLKKAWNKAHIIFNIVYKNLNHDVNDSLVKYWFQQYFIDKDSHPGIWELHHINVVTNKNNVNITITLGRPGLLIGKAGSNINSITEKLSVYLEKPVKINIIEYNPLDALSYYRIK